MKGSFHCSPNEFFRCNRLRAQLRSLSNSKRLSTFTWNIHLPFNTWNQPIGCRHDFFEEWFSPEFCPSRYTTKYSKPNKHSLAPLLEKKMLIDWGEDYSLPFSGRHAYFQGHCLPGCCLLVWEGPPTLQFDATSCTWVPSAPKSSWEATGTKAYLGWNLPSFLIFRWAVPSGKLT